MWWPGFSTTPVSPATFLEIEITEGALVKNRQIAAGNIRRLSALGVRVALDDFGTGYSGLSYLPESEDRSIEDRPDLRL